VFCAFVPDKKKKGENTHMAWRDSYGEHWSVRPQVEYFNPRGGKVACQKKDTCSERFIVGIHMWGSLSGGTMHMEGT